MPMILGATIAVYVISSKNLLLMKYATITVISNPATKARQGTIFTMVRFDGSTNSVTER